MTPPDVRSRSRTTYLVLAFTLPPSLAVVGTLLGTRWTVSTWEDCPGGNSAVNGFGLTFFTMPAVWLCMTVILGQLQVAIHFVGRPLGHRGAFWWLLLLPVIAAAALALIYRTGMGDPEVPNDGSCFQGRPSFPFGDKPDLAPDSRR